MKVFSLDRERILARLLVAAASLAQAHPEVDEVWLFGSLARGDARPGSDADVLVVLAKASVPFLERTPFYALTSCGIGVDLLAYTRAELSALHERAPRFAQAIEDERIPLFQRASLSEPILHAAIADGDRQAD